MSLFPADFLPLPVADRAGVPFDPALIDDVRAMLLMSVAGRRRRANWMLVRLVCRYPPDDVGRLLRAMYFDTPRGA